ncbi:mitochondrial inner membrane protein required for protein [Salix suchowensis]|nr:mitochondrial inner membrane protein required for protein [Salix suchowensis]
MDVCTSKFTGDVTANTIVAPTRLANCKTTRSRLFPRLYLAILRSRHIYYAISLRECAFWPVTCCGTEVTFQTAMPILEKLDKYNFFITHKLFRDATRSINGKIVKVSCSSLKDLIDTHSVQDLSYLNRDLSKVVLLDTHEDHISTHPENSILLPKWTGDPKDKGLVSMIPFLESLAIYKAPDVRPILEAYHGKDVPIEYAKKEAEAKQRHIEEWSKKSKGVSSSLTFSSMFGGSVPIGSALTYLEQKRLEAQQLYKEEQAYIMAHQEEFDKLLEQDQLAMNEGQPNSLWEMFGLMAGQTKPADPAASSSPPASPAPSSTASTSK